MVLVTLVLQHEEPTRKLSYVRTSDLLRMFFLLIRMLHFCFLHLHLTTMCHFSSNGDMIVDHSFTSWPVRYIAFQMLPSRTSAIEVGTGFISSNLWQWYCTLLTTFLSSRTILSVNKQLQFILSQKTIETTG